MLNISRKILEVLPMREKIEKILNEIIPGADLSCGTLIESGYIDSLALINLISELDIEFDIEITFSELNVDNFSSVESIQALVEQKVQAGGSSKE